VQAANAAEMVELWERTAARGPHERALLLLAWALPEHEFDTLADMDLGLRDWHLLRLRRALFGSRLDGYTDCPACGGRLEIELDARQLQDEHAPPDPAPVLDGDGRRFRLPNSRDLIAISAIDDVDAAERELMQRCCMDGDGDAVSTEIEDAMTVMASQRGFQLDMTCACCGEQWLFDFDPGAFVWEEIRARALELLDQVHRLAEAHGWSERAILAMTDARRNAYLERVS
jgi:hypothetical protein